MNPTKNHISYKYYMIFLYGPFLYMALGSIFLKEALEANLKIQETFEFIGGLLILTGIVFTFVVQYRIWKWIILRSRTNGIEPPINTPGQAVGFQFIPFFNIYWIYKSIGLVAKSLNAVLVKEGSKDKAPQTLNVFVIIFAYIGIIPFLGLPFNLINLWILYPILFVKCAKIINRNYKEE